MWQMCNETFYAAVLLTERKKKMSTQFVLASIMIQIIAVSFSISLPPYPWKTVQGKTRNNFQPIPKDIMIWSWCALVFMSGKWSYFLFLSPLWVFAFKKTPIFSLTHQVNLASFSKRSQAFFFCEVVEPACRMKTSSTQTQQLMCEMRWAGPTLFHAARKKKKSNSWWTAIALRTHEAESRYNSEVWKTSLLSANHALNHCQQGFAVSHMCLIKAAIKS